MNSIKLAKCACGKNPTDVSIYDATQGGKWANVQGNCCGEWMIEFRTNYLALDSDECKELAIAAWNDADRSPTELELLNQIKQEVKGMKVDYESFRNDYEDGNNDAINEVIQYLDKLIAERSEK